VRFYLGLSTLLPAVAVGLHTWMLGVGLVYLLTFYCRLLSSALYACRQVKNKLRLAVLSLDEAYDVVGDCKGY
jgi:hypothetical protein